MRTNWTAYRNESLLGHWRQISQLIFDPAPIWISERKFKPLNGRNWLDKPKYQITSLRSSFRLQYKYFKRIRIFPISRTDNSNNRYVKREIVVGKFSNRSRKSRTRYWNTFSFHWLRILHEFLIWPQLGTRILYLCEMEWQNRWKKWRNR